MGSNSVIVGWHLHVDKFGNVSVPDAWEAMIVYKGGFLKTNIPDQLSVVCTLCWCNNQTRNGGKHRRQLVLSCHPLLAQMNAPKKNGRHALCPVRDVPLYQFCSFFNIGQKCLPVCQKIYQTFKTKVLNDVKKNCRIGRGGHPWNTIFAQPRPVKEISSPLGSPST